MAYITGQVTSDASHVDTFITAIEAEMTLNAAWSFVSTFTAGSYTYRVWKNDGLQNTWGEDFYIALMYETAYASSDKVYVKIFEEWDDVGKLARRGAIHPGLSRSVGEVYASHREDTWDALGTNVTDTYHWTQNYFSTNYTDFTYWVLITTDCIIGGTSASSAIGVYVGLFDSLSPSAALEFPLVNAPLGDFDVDAGGSVIRRPDAVGVSQNDAFAVATPFNSVTYLWTPIYGEVGTTVEFYPGVMGSKPIVYHTYYSIKGIPYRGLYKHLLVFQFATGVEFGDTITIDAATYVLIAAYSDWGVWMDTTAT